MVELIPIVRISETFDVRASPEVVFDYMTNPANLVHWQTSKTLVEQLTDGPPGLGTRVRERTKPPGAKEFEQIVEFTEFDRPKRFHVHIVEGPYPVDGTWTFGPSGGGTASSSPPRASSADRCDCSSRSSSG